MVVCSTLSWVSPPGVSCHLKKSYIVSDPLWGLCDTLIYYLPWGCSYHCTIFMVVLILLEVQIWEMAFLGGNTHFWNALSKGFAYDYINPVGEKTNWTIWNGDFWDSNLKGIECTNPRHFSRTIYQGTLKCWLRIYHSR